MAVCGVRCAPRMAGPFVFRHQALAAVFRARLLAAMRVLGLPVPECAPERWVVDCKAVGSGHKVMVYLGRYLYRGVIQERDILRCDDHFRHLPLARWQVGQAPQPHGGQGGVCAPGVAARAAQRVSAGALLRPAASELPPWGRLAAHDGTQTQALCAGGCDDDHDG